MNFFIWLQMLEKPQKILGIQISVSYEVLNKSGDRRFKTGFKTIFENIYVGRFKADGRDFEIIRSKAIMK